MFGKIDHSRKTSMQVGKLCESESSAQFGPAHLYQKEDHAADHHSPERERRTIPKKEKCNTYNVFSSGADALDGSIPEFCPGRRDGRLQLGVIFLAELELNCYKLDLIIQVFLLSFHSLDTFPHRGNLALHFDDIFQITGTVAQETEK